MGARCRYSCYSDYIAILMIPKHYLSRFLFYPQRTSFMALSPTLSPGTTANRRRWIALIVVCLAMLMNALDSSIVNVALPSIQHDLHFSQANLTWVVDAYLIAFGSFLLLAARLGDLLGRNKVFLSGVALFTASSFVCS